MGKICTFFGHRDCVTYGAIEQKLTEAVQTLIETEGVDEFWLGNMGAFDACALGVLTRLKENNRRLNIRICYVMAYPIPKKQENWYESRFDDIIALPELTKCPHKAAICQRNKIMATTCDYLICYVRRADGGAYQAMRLAQNAQKTVINLNNQ